MKFSPYAYEPDKSIEVYKKTEQYFLENPKIKERIEELGWIYHTVGMVVPQNFENMWSGHFFPFIESWEELQISFNLVCFGLYKQAFVSLRSGLELGMLSVYYNINDDGHNAVKEWLKSKDTTEGMTPRADKIWNILLSSPNIKTFNDKNNIKSLYKDLSYLHNYVHTKGVKFSNKMGQRGSNFQTFEPKLIDRWIKSYSAIITLNCTLHLLKYPLSVIRFDYEKKFGIDVPNFGGLEEFNLDKIATILPEGYLSDIEEIAKNDPATQEALKDIEALPDMTEEQLEEQLLDMDKLSIEHGEGFTQWLENLHTFQKSFTEKEFGDKLKDRIEILRKWATENDFLESKPKRLGWPMPDLKKL